MLAARAYPDTRVFELVDIPVPEIAAREVLVRVKNAGLTHGLLSLWRDRGRIKLLPATLSQEGAGEIAAVGDEAFGVSVGDRVRVHPIVACGRCRSCALGRTSSCEATFLIGHAIYNDAALPTYARYHDGTLAEYVRVPVENVDRIPEGVGYDEAAKVHVLAVAWRAVRATEVGFGDTLVVMGATGATGAGAIAAARVFGVSRVIAVARTAQGLASVVERDPDLVTPLALESLPQDWRESRRLSAAIRERTADGGAHGVVDFLPAERDATEQAIMSLGMGGRAVLSGGNREQIRLNYGAFRVKKLSLLSSNGYERRDAVELMEAVRQRRYDVQRLISHRYPLSDVNSAVVDIDERRGNPMLVSIAV